ncbi:MAG: HAD-IA family hydrolase [Treponema sp.]|jgi:beta-phosphoglucomutase-like phosphatase (HAD superfamily)|nr:HAD-IA family hydrolase [Treponema sp.]
MSVNNTGAVIFDMDGVLTNSEWFIAEAGRLMFEETHKTAVTHEDFLPFTGLGENRFLGGVAEKYGLAAFDIERDKARAYEIYGDLIKGKLKALPGAVEFVRGCRALELKTALATSTDYVKMMASLTEIGLIKPQISAAEAGLATAAARAAENAVFDAMVNGLDVERRKPFPDIFLEAARRIETAPERCWVVEDSVGGVAAAKAAGMRCLALLTTFPEEEIKAAGADIIVKDLSCISPRALLDFS